MNYLLLHVLQLKILMRPINSMRMNKIKIKTKMA